ncbi:MAG: alpha/beta hydrolase family protein [Gammaproteobacteria bacterium]
MCFGSIWEEQQKVDIGDYDNDKDYLDAVSPINLVDRIDTPLYIVHGVRDWRVPIQACSKSSEKSLRKMVKEEGEDFWWLVKS